MSLFGTIQLANNTLLANQIGLQVVSQNIANANTPGYSRAEVNFQPAATQRQGGVLLGLGVQVNGVVQKVDRYLNERLRQATSDRANSEMQSAAYRDLEQILGALNDGNLSTSMTQFISSISDILNQPDSASVRNLATLRGRTLAQDIRNLAQRVTKMRNDINQQITGAVREANELIEQVRALNVRISALEGGSTSNSDAVGLRDQRNLALGRLAELIGINVIEQDSSSTNVFNNGEFLVFEGISRSLTITQTVRGDESIVNVVFSDTLSLLTSSTGKIAGLLAARDEVLGGFQTQLNGFAQTFAFEFNKLFSSGQGLAGYTSLTSTNAVSDVSASLEKAGLPFRAVSGGFEVMIRNTQTGLTTLHQINIDLDGLNNNDTTLQSLRATLDAIDGLAAQVTPAGELVLTSESPVVEFSFGNDTSGVLAALGINTFFTGTNASNLQVNAEILNDPRKFTASSGGIGADTQLAAQLAGFLDRPLDSLQGASIAQLRNRMTEEVSESSAAMQAVYNGFESYEGSLESQSLSISGVNLDEEAVRMLAYQRAYQAAARFISTINELLDTIVKL